MGSHSPMNLNKLWRKRMSYLYAIRRLRSFAFTSFLLLGILFSLFSLFSSLQARYRMIQYTALCETCALRQYLRGPITIWMQTI
jgi:hypothetical protein